MEHFKIIKMKKVNQRFYARVLFKLFSKRLVKCFFETFFKRSTCLLLFLPPEQRRQNQRTVKKGSNKNF